MIGYTTTGAMDRTPPRHPQLSNRFLQPEQLAAYAATGIDLISTSAPVTRSPWLDLSMRFEP